MVGGGCECWSRQCEGHCESFDLKDDGEVVRDQSDKFVGIDVENHIRNRKEQWSAAPEEKGRQNLAGKVTSALGKMRVWVEQCRLLERLVDA